MNRRSIKHPSSDGLEGVDEEIRSLMKDINDLPFVSRTIMSCAGYGVDGIGSQHEKNKRLGKYFGWFSVEFKEYTRRSSSRHIRDAVHTFDEDMSRIANEGVQFYAARRRRYSFSGRTETALKRRWDKVQAVVDKYLET